MPELPDLQVFSRNLHQKLKGKSVKKAMLYRSKNSNISEEELIKQLQHEELLEVGREGKELHFKFGNENILAFHLMLNGELHMLEEGEELKYQVLELLFVDGVRLVLSDRRGMAKVTLNPEKSGGIDALSKDLNIDFLKDMLSQKKTTIKNFLLDQQIIKGIGNAYADEILWDAGVSPFSICSKIPTDKVNDLIKSIKKVLTNAEMHIRETYPDITYGEVRDFLLIHNPKQHKSPNGAPIKTEKVGARKTYYTDEQHLYK